MAFRSFPLFLVAAIVAVAVANTWLAASAVRDEFVVVGYLPSYRLKQWGERDVRPVTDVVFFHLLPSDDGSLVLDVLSDDAVRRLNVLKERFGARISVTVGGWGHTELMSSVCADPVKRGRLVEDLVSLTGASTIESVDFDWEHPENEQQWDDYVALIEETRRGLVASGGICSVAISSSKRPPERLFEVVDRVHLMSYDHAYPHATYEKTVADVERVLSWACPREKLVLGLPFYGRGKDWKAKSYRAILEEGGAAGPQSDGADVTASGVAFNGPDTVARKVRFAVAERLGGVMIWELGQDASEDDRSLLRTIERTLAE